MPSPTVSKTPQYFCFKLWHHNQYTFTLGILFHHHQTVSDRWTTHRRGEGIIAMAWVVLVETVIDMRVSILFTNLLTLNVMTLMAKYHKKKANWLWKTIQIWTIHPHSYGYKIILTHNSNPAYLSTWCANQVTYPRFVKHVEQRLEHGTSLSTVTPDQGVDEAV